MTLSGFSHVALTVSDMCVSEELYSQILGLAVLDSSGSFARCWPVVTGFRR